MGGETAALGRVEPVPQPATSDRRQVFRLLVDVLAEPEQVEALLAVLGTAVCGLPDHHDGACRLAWRITATGADRDLPVAPEVAHDVREALSALEVWPADVATASLLAEAGALGRAAGPAGES